MFAIWWSTSPKPVVEKSSAPSPHIDFALPRGGSLTGSLPADVDEQQAIALLTAAPLFRVNRSTDEVEPWLAEVSVSSTDKLVYTIKLRRNVTRADGAALVEDLRAKIDQVAAGGGEAARAKHVARGKPAPDLYLHAADALGVPIGRIAIVED